MISPKRLEALADGVFAIVMTLLVIELRVPTDSGHRLYEAFKELAPHIGAYVLAFILVGTAWVSHHGQFHHIKQTDRNGLWLNLLFLMSVSLVPFFTATLAHYPLDPFAVMLFGGLMVWNSLAIFFIWRHARVKRFVNCPESTCALIEAHAAIAVGIYTIGLVVAAWSPRLALTTYIFVPVIYLIPWKVRHG